MNLSDQAILTGRLLVCGHCLRDGIRRPIGRLLGEDATGGSVAIMRFAKFYTVIRGYFTVTCGDCGSPLIEFTPRKGGV